MLTVYATRAPLAATAADWHTHYAYCVVLYCTVMYSCRYKLLRRKPGSLREGSAKHEGLMTAERNAREMYERRSEQRASGSEMIEHVRNYTSPAILAQQANPLAIDIHLHTFALCITAFPCPCHCPCPCPYHCSSLSVCVRVCVTALCRRRERCQRGRARCARMLRVTSLRAWSPAFALSLRCVPRLIAARRGAVQYT